MNIFESGKKIWALFEEESGTDASIFEVVFHSVLDWLLLPKHKINLTYLFQCKFEAKLFYQDFKLQSRIQIFTYNFQYLKRYPSKIISSSLV